MYRYETSIVYFHCQTVCSVQDVYIYRILGWENLGYFFWGFLEIFRDSYSDCNETFHSSDFPSILKPNIVARISVV